MLARLGRHFRQHVVGYIALFVALGGTGAYATHERIFSSDIVDGEVRSVDVRDDALTGTDVKESTLDLPFRLLRDFEPAEVSTSNKNATDLGGPSVTVDVPPGSLVWITFFGQLKGCKPEGTYARRPVAQLFEETDFPDGGASASSDYFPYLPDPFHRRGVPRYTGCADLHGQVLGGGSRPRPPCPL